MVDFNVGTILSGVTSGLGIIQKMVWIGIICAAIFAAWYYMQFKHHLVIKNLGNKSKLRKLDKFREFRDKEGIVWWQIWSNKRKIAEAPASAVEIDNKGKKWAHLYETESGEYIYGIDIATLKEVPQELKDIPDTKTRELKISEWRKDNNVVDAYQPYTAKQRMVLVSQHKKALEKRKKDWKEMVVPTVALISMTLIIVSLMVFAGEVIKPLIEYSDKLIDQSKQNQQMLTETRQLLGEIRAAKGCGVASPIVSAPPN